MNRLPLQGVRVLDFTNLLPGPLATLMLAETGAAIVKVERPGGDLGRRRVSGKTAESVEFALLNRGKKSIVLDLKTGEGSGMARKLALEADVLVEQFRPGVMARLGLGYEALRERNPGLIYCSISGYGQNGPLAGVAAHDLNYIARSGMLGTSVGQDGRPVLPQGQMADIGGGSYPAVINILLALLRRKDTHAGCYLDIAMAENTFAWMRRPLACVFAGDPAPAPGAGRNTGGSPRYCTYLAADGVALAVAAIEEPFWNRFCDLIDLSKAERNDSADPAGVLRRVADRLAARSSAEWKKRFENEDVCVEVVQSVEAAFNDPHFRERGVFARQLRLHGNQVIPALPMPLAGEFLSPETRGYPALGNARADATDLWEQ